MGFFFFLTDSDACLPIPPRSLSLCSSVLFLFNGCTNTGCQLKKKKKKMMMMMRIDDGGEEDEDGDDGDDGDGDDGDDGDGDDGDGDDGDGDDGGDDDDDDGEKCACIPQKKKSLIPLSSLSHALESCPLVGSLSLSLGDGDSPSSEIPIPRWNPTTMIACEQRRRRERMVIGSVSEGGGNSRSNPRLGIERYERVRKIFLVRMSCFGSGGIGGGGGGLDQWPKSNVQGF
jgi:hypothetical protein